MATKWTQEQQRVITTRNHNMLVSAAAGSGKTAVLVERIIKRITDRKDPVDIDRLLVVTFTKAAAAEMRERIAAAIDKIREEFPEDERLEQQQTLIHNAQITTIDSFCLFVVRNHFEEISLDPNFRIADTGELRLLEQDVLAEVFESHYGAENNEEFLHLVDAYSKSRSDGAVKEMVSQIYQLSRSQPWPREWIRSLADAYEVSSVEQLEQTQMIREIVDIAKARLMESRETLETLKTMALTEDGLQKYAESLEQDLELLKEVDAIANYSQMRRFLSGFKMKAIAQIRNFEGDGWKKEYIKNTRGDVKKSIDKVRKDYFEADLETIQSQMLRIRPTVHQLVEVSLDYLQAMEENKRQKRMVDFGDIEHFALKILVDEKTKELRPAAEEFRRHFEEIMLDEYQDSNQVQESIMQAISRGNNMFMVGDVKQSIYRFRLARPELFMEKYAAFSPDGKVDMRIDLHKNFRSRAEVLDFTNDIFYKIMQKDLGNVAYDDEAALYCGAAFPDAQDMQAEVLLYDLDSAQRDGEENPDEGTGAEGTGKQGVVQPEEDPQKQEENSRRLEARMIAHRILRLMKDGRITDKETGELREVHFRDIVILMRTVKGWDSDFTEILESYGIPVHVESSTGYFSAVEVQTVLAFLKILDNPYQDIPMAAVLKSPIVGLREEDLAEIRINHRDLPFAAAAVAQMEEEREGSLFEFYQMYQSIRSSVRDTPIHELILRILRESGYGNYAAAMPAGSRRAANLDMLVEKAIAYEKTSYKGLFHFVRYIEQLRKYDVDFGEADVTGENADVVHLMTIHKSKGLEFPIVFVSGISKPFNQMDARQGMVLHADLGLGIWEMTTAPRVKIPTLTRCAIADRIVRENLGEELRVLYVALTRAREKLILTGTVGDWGKALQKYKGNAKEKKPVPFTAREKAGSYLDWLMPAMLSYPGKYDIQLAGAKELVLAEAQSKAQEQIAYQDLVARIHKADDSAFEEFTKHLSFEYPYQADADRKSKYSVSELKHDSMLQKYDAAKLEAEIPDFLREEKEPFVPAFAQNIQEDQSASASPGVSRGALRGTAVHRVMECLDFAAIADLDRGDAKAVHAFVKGQLDNMLSSGEITEEMHQLVLPSMIEAFVLDGVALRMAQAQLRGELFREKPFVMDYQGVLVQGIIDVFWIEDDRLIVLDYKTDRVETGEELVSRYKTQLELYADALTRVFSGKEKKMRAEESLIYSFRLKEVIRI